MRRRDVLKLLTAAALSGVVPRIGRAAEGDELYDIGKFGNARVLHMTDTHAQLAPVYFREPSVNLGIGAMAGQAAASGRRGLPQAFRHRAQDARCAHAFTYLDFAEAAHRYGRLGGFAHLKTLIDRLRAEAGAGRSLLLDGGDLWQGSGLANIMHGEDMVDAANLLGIEAMTGALGIHLRRGEAARQHQALQGRVPGAERVPDRGGRVRQQAGLRQRERPRIQAGDDQGARRLPHRRDRPGAALRADRASQALHARLDLRHPRAGAAEGRRRPAAERQGRRRHPAVAQRHGSRPQARQPRHRHRRHPRRPHPRRRAAADRGRQCRRQDAGDQWRLEPANSSACSISSSPRAPSRTCAIICCRSMPGC